MSDDPNWFAPKRYGYGAGLPIAWQGWAVLLGYLVLVGLGSAFMRHSTVAYLSAVSILTAVFLVICARTTKGGWRWRWGQEE